MILIQAVTDADSGVPVEQIADAVGHSSTRMGPLFGSRGKTNGGLS
jgi:hypothetical protein